MYVLKVYTDAHDETSINYKITKSAIRALDTAIEEANNLKTEPSDIEIGSAADSEMCEIYPTHGNGTVVIEECDHIHSIEELFSE